MFLLLLLPNIYTAFAATDLVYSPLKTVAYVAVVAVCLLLPAFVLKARAYFIVEGVISLFAAPIEIASLYLNKATASTSFLNLVFQTDMGEATELLSSYWVVVVVLLLLWGSYFFLAAKQEREWLFPRTLQWWVIGLLPVMLIAGGAVFAIYAKRFYNKTSAGDIALTAADLALMKFEKIYPYDFYINTCKIVQEQRRIAAYNRALESFSFGIQPRKDSVPAIYVLVIGETARSMNFSLNGYERPTNPLLSKRSNLVSFPHAYSQANLTSFSVPHILSRITAAGHDSIFSEKSLVEAFAEAGTATCWISNQHAGTYVDRILRTADSVYTTTKDATNEGNLDIYLADQLNRYLQTTEHKSRFVVVHSLGSHWRYDLRYTDRFAVWQPSISDNFSQNLIQPQNRQLLLNTYDNSILYTDYFLDSLISVLEHTHLPAFMLYLSDHGENLYDDERQLVLHGTYIGTEYEYNIPFIAWYSDEFAALHPEMAAALQDNRPKRFNSATVFHTMLSAAGITEIADQEKNLLAPTLQEQDTLFALTGEQTLTSFTKEESLQ